MSAAARRPDSGDLDALRIEALADARQWFAIAAIAKASAALVDQAISALASNSADAEAFTWLWSLLRHGDVQTTDESWPYLNLMPTPIAVPDALVDQVTAFVASSGNDALAGERAGRIAILERLPTKVQKAVARAVLEAAITPDEHPPAEVVWIASYKLAEKPTKADRTLLARAAMEADAVPTASERLRMLNLLDDPASDTEREGLTAATIAALEEAASTSEGIPAIQVAWNRLPNPDRRRITADPFTTSPNVRHLVLTAAVAERLGAQAVLDAIRPDLSGDPTTIDAATAASIVDDLVTATDLTVASDLLLRAHDVLAPELLEPARTSLLTRLAEYHVDDDRRAPALAALLECVVTKCGTSSASALVARMYPGDMTPASAGLDLTSPEAAKGLGVLLWQFVQSGASRPDHDVDDELNARGADALTVIDALKPDTRAAVFTPFTWEFAPLLGFVIDYILDHPELAGAAVEAGHLEPLVARVEGQPLDETSGITQMMFDLISAAPDDATAKRVLAVLSQSLKPRAATWDGDIDSSIIDLLDGRPELLCEVALEQVTTLDGPKADAAPTERIERLVSAALDVGLADYTTSAEACVPSLTRGNPRLQALAARWMGLSGPWPVWVDLCVDSDTRYLGDSPYAPVLADFADALAPQATDTTREVHERVSDLELCAQAHLPTARTAAFTILTTPDEHEDLRVAAARVVADGDGTAAEADVLESLLAGETSRDIGHLLDRALHRIKSGSIGQAMSNLLALVGSVHDPKNVPVAVVLPYPQFHEAFESQVDATSACQTAPAKAIVNQYNVMSDALVVMGVVTHWLATDSKKNHDQAAAMLAAPGASDAGALLTQQELLLRVPWLIFARSLRQYRDTHFTEHGTNKPVRLPPNAEQYCRDQLQQVVDGWIEWMIARNGKQ